MQNDLMKEVLFYRIRHFNHITPALEKVIGQGLLNFSVYFLIFSKRIPFTTAMSTLLLSILIHDNLTIEAYWCGTVNFWGLRSEFGLLNSHEQ